MINWGPIMGVLPWQNALFGIKFDNRLAFGSKRVMFTLINQGPLLIGGPVSF
jgi:hypothetical protein